MAHGVTGEPVTETKPWVTGTEQLRCSELIELVTEYLDDAMTPADREAFDSHLEGCRDCQVYVDQMRQTIRALGALDLP